MRSKMLPGILTLAFFALAFSAPAGALTITIGGAATDCTLLSNNRIGLESGPTHIVGNVCVTGANGILDVGSGIRIEGRAIAKTIKVGSGSVIDVCEATTVTGPGTCTTILPFPTVPAWPPIVIAALPVCVDTAPNFTVPAGVTDTLAPGCYGVVTVGAGATLNLAAGNYDVLDLQLQNGATIDGAGPTATIVSSKKVITILANSKITDIRIQTPLASTGEVLQIGNGTQVDNALLYAPNGKLHLHNLSFGTGSEFVSNAMQVEVVDLNQPPPGPKCPCIEDATKVNATTISLTGSNLLSSTFFLSLGCNCPGAGCTVATPVAGGSDTALDVTIPGGLPAGNYHVVAQGTAGTFCTADLITIP